MTLNHVLESSVLEGLSPRFLSNVVHAVASAPAVVRNQHAPAAINLVLPVLLQSDKLAVSNDQVGGKDRDGGYFCRVVPTIGGGFVWDGGRHLCNVM